MVIEAVGSNLGLSIDSLALVLGSSIDTGSGFGSNIDYLIGFDIDYFVALRIGFELNIGSQMSSCCHLVAVAIVVAAHVDFPIVRICCYYL